MSSTRFIAAEPPARLARSRFGPWVIPAGGYSDSVSDTITLGDSAIAVWAGGVSGADSITLADSVATLWSGTATASDAVALGDSVTSLWDGSVSGSDAIILGDGGAAFVNSITPPISTGAPGGKLSLPSAFVSPVDGDRARGGYWTFWEAVRKMLTGQAGIICLPPYTVATLPPASLAPGGVIYVTDGSSNRRMAISDGTDWRFPDGDIVS